MLEKSAEMIRNDKDGESPAGSSPKNSTVVGQPGAPSFFVLIDGYGVQTSLHATKQEALERGKTYDGFSIVKLQVGGKDKCTDMTYSEDEEPKPKKKRSRFGQVEAK